MTLFVFVRHVCEVCMFGVLRRAGALAVAGIALMMAIVAGAWAGTITTPASSPFGVPGDPAGNPLSFTVVGSGYPNGSTVAIEQCDGVSPSTVGWSPIDNCDIATAPAAVDVGANGLATFPANDPNFGFTPFKGPSPQNK